MNERNSFLAGIAITYFLIFIFVCGCNQPKREPLTVSTTELMSDFVRDAYAADMKYTSRHLILTGKIGLIRSKESANYVNQFEYTIRMQTGDIDGISTEVVCYFGRSEASSLRHLKEGDSVKILGYVWKPGFSLDLDGKQGGLQRGTYRDTGETYYFVEFHRCKLVK